MDVCRKDGFLMTIERVEKVREFCTQNVEHAGSRSVFEIIQVSKDCDGGLNFEEAIDRYKIESGGWICESVVEKTMILFAMERISMNLSLVNSILHGLNVTSHYGKRRRLLNILPMGCLVVGF